MVATGGTLPYSFAWSWIDDGLSAGTYTVTVSDAIECTTEQTVTINEPALLEAELSSTLIVSGDDGTATALVSGGILPYTYLWETGATTDIIENLTEEAFYVVTITDANNCILVDSVFVGFAVATNEIKETKFQLFPNPTNGYFYVLLETAIAENWRVEIYDAKGQILPAEQRKLPNGNTQISLENYPAGLYFCKIQLGTEVYWRKVVKE